MMTRTSKLVLSILSVASITLLLLFAVFPGLRGLFALVLLTGVGRDRLQVVINQVQSRAIKGARASREERAFLADFYWTLAQGGRLSGFARQSGDLMAHYLEGSGKDFKLRTDIFTTNANVMLRAHIIKGQIRKDNCAKNQSYSSGVFYMPHPSSPDSIFGLYHGTLEAKTRLSGQACEISWVARVPWIWPSYAEITKKTGTPHGESFPLPSLRSLLMGMDQSLFVDNGLGRYIEDEGLAKRFLAYGQWKETLPVSSLPYSTGENQKGAD